MDNKKTKRERTNGVQHTIYFDKLLWDHLLAMKKKTGLGISPYIRSLLYADMQKKEGVE